MKMKIISEIVGLFIISLTFMAVPILCSLSFAYNWLVFFKFILFIACFAELIGIMSLLAAMFDKQD